MNDTIFRNVESGFAGLHINIEYQQKALRNLKEWLTDEPYTDYIPQIMHLISTGQWDYLLDCFYQTIPFGTGGRRGEVGIGPNRINPVTIRYSAQGHAQFLIKQHRTEAQSRGVVLGYDVREFNGNNYLSTTLPNPVSGLQSKDLAIFAAEVYAGNGIKVNIFDDVRTTPELSFAIRHLKAVGGAMFSASHNPPTHNGKKVYDEFGGQLIPPHDELLVKEVTENVTEILALNLDTAKGKNLIEYIGHDVDDAYISAATKISLSKSRDIKIAYTPLHGAGTTSVTKILSNLGFGLHEDPLTVNHSGKFENITFQIPNPEVTQSFDTSLEYAKSIDADILISTDPDADRIGAMVKHKGEWLFLNGNEIATILTRYAATRLNTPGQGIVVKTVVTTGAIKSICEGYRLKLIDGLLIGFKYVGDCMNNLEKNNSINDFLIGVEESHGYLAGNYARDKDAAVGAIWLSELAAELKAEGKTLIDFLNETYMEFGYYKNYLTEIRMLGATGNEKIHRIQKSFRANMPKHFERFKVIESTDYQTHEPIVSETDRLAKDILVFHLMPSDTVSSIKITIRPSGTEPKIKIYIEIGFDPTSTTEELQTVMESSDALVKEVEKAVLLEMYSSINITFPERGFLLFWQLPLDDKLRYFEIEPKLIKTRSIADKGARRTKVNELLAFLGSNPEQKVNAAFEAEYGSPLDKYLDI